MESTKNADIRVNNRKRVVNTLFRSGAMTKQELANRLELSLPTVTLLLKELKQKGLIVNGEALSSTGGRKPVLLMPVYGVKYAVGIEVSLHELRMVMLDLGANVIAQKMISHEFDVTREYWETISRETDLFIEQNVGDSSQVLYGGIALQISLRRNGDIWEGMVHKERMQFNIQMVESCFHRPVIVYDSAKMAAIAQIQTKKQLPDSFLYVSIGSLMAGAIVYEKRIVGFDSPNGEFDRMFLGDPQKKERMEDYCTVDAICRRAFCATISDFFTKLENGDVVCQSVWEEIMDILFVFLHNMGNIFGWRIVIGGAISPYLKAWEETLNSRLKELDEETKFSGPRILVSDSGAYSAAMGVAITAIDEFLEFGFSDL